MNAPLFKMLIKKNWLVWLIVTTVIIVYLGIIVATYGMIEDLAANEDTLALLELLGLDFSAWATPLAYVSDVFFSIYGHVFLMVLFIIYGMRFGHKTIDTKTLSCYLSGSVSRQKYITTCAVFMALSIVALMTVTFIAGSIMFVIAGGEFNAFHYLNVIATMTAMALAVSFIVFFISFTLGGQRSAAGLVISAPVAMFLLLIISQAARPLSFLRFFTPYGWASAVSVATGDFPLWWLVQLGCLALAGVMFALSFVIFKKRQLSI